MMKSLNYYLERQMTLVELLAKIQNGTATTEEIGKLAGMDTAEQESKKKAEEAFTKLINDIKKAKIDPVVLYSKLVEEGLIVVPVVEEDSDDKTPIATEAITTAKGRKSKFKIWNGRPLDKLTGEAKKNWTALQAKGKEYFLTILTDEGRKLHATDEKFQKWIDGLFAKK